MKRHIEELRRLDGNKITNSYLKQPVSLSKHLIKLQSLLVTSMIARQLNKYSYSKLYLEDCLSPTSRDRHNDSINPRSYSLALMPYSHCSSHTHYGPALRTLNYTYRIQEWGFLPCQKNDFNAILSFCSFFLALPFFSLSPCLLFVFGCTGTWA